MGSSVDDDDGWRPSIFGLFSFRFPSALRRLPHFGAREAISSSRKSTSFPSSTRWPGRALPNWYCAGQPGGISGKRDLHHSY